MKKIVFFTIIVVSSIAQAVSLEVQIREKPTQEEYLARFEAAKRDPHFCHFVSAFEQKAEDERPFYDLPPQHLDCNDLSKTNRARIKEAEEADKAVSKSFKKIRKTAHGHRHTCCCHCPARNEVNNIDTTITLLQLPIKILSLLHNAGLHQEQDKISELKMAQKDVRTNLTALAPVYQRCKKLPQEDQQQCLDTVKLDLYNLYANYLKQEKQLFPNHCA